MGGGVILRNRLADDDLDPDTERSWTPRDSATGSLPPLAPPEPDADRALQRDITERLLLEALRQRDLAKDGSSAMLAFLGRVSHEMRTPLNAIFGYVDLLDMEVHGPVTERQRVDLERIRASQRQLLVMINDLLDFLKVQSGQLEHRSVDVPMSALLNEALALMEPSMTAKGIRSGGVTCEREVTARGDPDRIEQIVLNLLTNAIKFTPAGGEIGIVCDASGDVVQVRVNDSGIGISPDRTEAIFRPFMQVANSLTGSKQGVGLGLAISRDLARAMRGDLTVASTVDVGSVFILTLPRT